MPARTILYTGKGGVGKTSVAAATAVRCAARGLRTIVMSTDPAHSLADTLGVEIGGEPCAIGPSLWAQQIAAQQELERNWAGVQDWLGELLVARGVDRISAEELTVPPGLDELFSLLALRRHHQGEDYDVVIVDCAPTGETLRLLSFPDVARWWIEKVIPQQGQLLAAARPLARAMLDLNLPGEEVLDDVQRLVSGLVAMNEILADRERVSIRLVMNPDRMVIDEARRTFTYLCLYGYLTDAVVVNRVFPDDVGAYFDGWREVQRGHLADVQSAFAPVPILRAPYFEREVIGTEMLARLGDALFGDSAAEAVLHDRPPHALQVHEDGATLALALPFVAKGQIGLKMIGPELIVRVDSHKRTIMLPPALARLRPREARLDDGVLTIDFSSPAQPTAAAPEESHA